MTKPIEGWVVQAVNRPDIISSIFEIAEDAAEEYQITEKTSQWRVRPVRLTFTDEAVINEESDLGMAFLAGAAWRKGDEIADVIRKERERIYSELQPHIGEDSYSETEDGDREYSVPTDRCLRGIIFGEEE